MFVDDFILRQIDQIANLVASVASAATDQESEDPDQQIADAYETLLGMDFGMVEAMDAETILRMVHEERELEALVDLTVAHAEATAQKGDTGAARRRLARALSYLPDGHERTATLLSRFEELSARSSIDNAPAS